MSLSVQVFVTDYGGLGALNNKIFIFYDSEAGKFKIKVLANLVSAEESTCWVHDIDGCLHMVRGKGAF